MPTSRPIVLANDVVHGTDPLGVGFDGIDEAGDHPLVRRGHAEPEPAFAARFLDGRLDRLGLQLEQDVARIDPCRVERGVVHDLRVAPLERLADEADPTGHRIIRWRRPSAATASVADGPGQPSPGT